MATQKNKIGKKTKPHRRLLRVLELDVIFTTYPLKYLLNICSSSVINLLEVLKEVPKSHVTRLSESKQNQYLPLSHLICRLIYKKHLNISSMASICPNQLGTSVIAVIVSMHSYYLEETIFFFSVFLICISVN